MRKVIAIHALYKQDAVKIEFDDGTCITLSLEDAAYLSFVLSDTVVSFN